MRKYRRIIGIIGLTCMLLCTGCGGKASATDEMCDVSTAGATVSNYDYSEGEIEETKCNAAYEMSDSEFGTANSEIVSDSETSEGKLESETAKNSGRKLVRTVSMSIETYEYDDIVKNIERKVKESGGYIENLDMEGYGENRYAYIIARVPEKCLDGFVNQVSENNNLVSKNETTEDVTLSYVDVASRKKSLEVEQERVLSLLEKADTMEAIIALEDKLENLRYQIENIESQLRTYDNLVSYSTVNITLNEVTIYTPVKKLTDIERMTQGFMGNVNGVINGIKNFGIDVVISLPILICFAIIILIIVFIIKVFIKIIKKNTIKKEKYYNPYMQNSNGFTNNIQPNSGIQNQTKEQHNNQEQK